MFGFKESYIRSLVPHLDVPMEWGSSSISLNIWIHVFLFVFWNSSIWIYVFGFKEGCNLYFFSFGFTANYISHSKHFWGQFQKCIDSFTFLILFIFTPVLH